MHSVSVIAIDRGIKRRKKMQPNLTDAYRFCRFFGDSANKAGLLSLINAVMENSGLHTLRDIHLLDSRANRGGISEKPEILDLYALDSAGRFYRIEMQAESRPDFIKRSIFFLTNMYQRQIRKFRYDSDLKPCISINFLDFEIFPLDEKARREIDAGEPMQYHSYYFLSSEDGPPLSFSHDLGLHYIEIPKVDFSVKNLNLLEKWLYFIKHTQDDEIIRQIRSEVPEIDAAARSLGL